jgi:hypothetical protein
MVGRSLSCVLVASLALAACGPRYYVGDVRVTSPALLATGSGAWVVADAEEPVFVARGEWWLFRGGFWHRGDAYWGGFRRVDFIDVPPELHAIARPEQYARYLRTRAFSEPFGVSPSLL